MFSPSSPRWAREQCTPAHMHTVTLPDRGETAGANGCLEEQGLSEGAGTWQAAEGRQGCLKKGEGARSQGLEESKAQRQRRDAA